MMSLFACRPNIAIEKLLHLHLCSLTNEQLRELHKQGCPPLVDDHFSVVQRRLRCCLLRLPDDILALCFTYLDARTWPSLRQACKLFQKLSIESRSIGP